MRNKILKTAALALCALFVVGGANLKVKAEDNLAVGKENIQSIVNAECVVDTLGTGGGNSLKITPADNGLSGIWYTAPELDKYSFGDKVHFETTVRLDQSGVKYASADFANEAGEYIDGGFRIRKWQNLLYDATVYVRDGKKCVFIGVKNGENVTINLSKVAFSDDVYDKSDMFGGVTLYQIEPQVNQTEGFMLVTKNGKIVMMDGGDYKDKDTVLNLIRSYKNEVDYWFVSHYHCDHVYSVLRILNEEDIYIRNLYFDFDVSDEVLNAYGDEDNHLVAEFREAVANNRSKIGNVITPAKRDEYVIDEDLKVKVLNKAYFREQSNMPNDSSVVYKFETPKKSILFLGDMGTYGDDLIKDEYFKSEAETCEVVQMGHHGQNGVSNNFYKSLKAMKVCLYCAPAYVFDCDDGNGYGTVTRLKTLETRELMRTLKVRLTISCKNGRTVLR